MRGLGWGGVGVRGGGSHPDSSESTPALTVDVVLAVIDAFENTTFPRKSDGTDTAPATRAKRGSSVSGRDAKDENSVREAGAELRRQRTPATGFPLRTRTRRTVARARELECVRASPRI